MKTYGDQDATPSEEAIRVTRSITIVKPPGYQSGSPPVSPAGSTPPASPFSGKLVAIQSFRLLLAVPNSLEISEIIKLQVGPPCLVLAG